MNLNLTTLKYIPPIKYYIFLVSFFLLFLTTSCNKNEKKKPLIHSTVSNYELSESTYHLTVTVPLEETNYQEIWKGYEWAIKELIQSAKDAQKSTQNKFIIDALEKIKIDEEKLKSMERQLREHHRKSMPSKVYRKADLVPRGGVFYFAFPFSAGAKAQGSIRVAFYMPFKLYKVTTIEKETAKVVSSDWGWDATVKATIKAGGGYGVGVKAGFNVGIGGIWGKMDNVGDFDGFTVLGSVAPFPGKLGVFFQAGALWNSFHDFRTSGQPKQIYGIFGAETGFSANAFETHALAAVIGNPAHALDSILDGLFEGMGATLPEESKVTPEETNSAFIKPHRTEDFPEENDGLICRGVNTEYRLTEDLSLIHPEEGITSASAEHNMENIQNPEGGVIYTFTMNDGSVATIYKQDSKFWLDHEDHVTKAPMNCFN